jgi:tellurite resistance protein TerC
MNLHTVGSAGFWAGFAALVLALLALDFGVFHRNRKEFTTRRAALELSFWVALALAFDVGVFFRFGADRGTEFLTGYLLEYSLSVDNLFVFLAIFRYFAVPPASQHRALFWGVIGSISLRILFILPGAALVQSFRWVLYLFGAFLVYTGGRLFFKSEEPIHPENNPALRAFRRWVPFVPQYRDQAFTVIENGKRFATPLLLVVFVLTGADIVFAADSIPAIFGITTDAFIVITAEVFACLGLMSLFFVISRMMTRFRYLQVGLAFVLIIIGVKMLVSDWLHGYRIYVPSWAPLVIVAVVLGIAIVASVLRPATEAP